MGKPQIVKFEQNHCNADINDNSVLFVRVADEIRDKHAMIEVPYTHNAYIIKGGGDARFYKSGAYDVFDDRKEIKAWKKGFSVDVIYMPKDCSLIVFWGTPQRFTYRDEASNHVVNIGARGQFGVTIANPEQFFRKVVGVRREFDKDDFQTRFSAEVVNEFSDAFLKAVAERKLTYDQFDAHKKDIGITVGGILSPKFEKSWGVGLTDFIIEWVGIDASDKAAVENAAAEKRLKEEREKKLKEYLAEIERLDDKQWERDKYLRQLELQDKNAYYDVLKVIGHAPVVGVGAGAAGIPSGASLFCSNCGKPYTAAAIFCPNCGNRLVKEKTACPKCGSNNEADAMFCATCGNKLK
ncbi:MAG: hypothetical protein HFK09_03290 [Clostridia bacterium]|nr:hypothetical protein [Clostridia bacterium]